MANGGPPKKAPARRVTTAALQDRVEALSAQVQLLLGQNAPKAPATPVAAASHVVEIRASNSKTVRCTESKYWRRRPCEGSCPSVSASSSEVWCSQSIPCCSQAWTCYVRGRALHFLRSASGNMLMALSQQSSALTALVAHLTAGGGDPLLDFGSSSSSSSSTSTRGLLRREKLIADLSAGSSTFFLQFQQQLFRKMNPSMVAPKTEEDIQKNPPSLADYLERHGGFKSQRTLGIILWMLSYAMDAGARREDRLMKEHLALAVASIEQCAVDQREWGLGFLLSLSADPPLQLFQDRHQTVAMHQRSFGGLVPPQWSTVAVASLKEMEVLNTKKQDLSKKSRTAIEDAEDPDASPRRRPRFPKRPKAKAKADGA